MIYNINQRRLPYTLENYSSMYAGYSVDIRDEVRSAILDGVDISEYIDQCASNPYRLNQIRHCLKAGGDYINLINIPTGEHIYKARQLVDNGVNVDPLLGLGTGIDPSYYDSMLYLLECGAVLPKDFDLSDVPESLLDAVVWALMNNLPVTYIMNNRDWLTPDYAKVIVGSLKQGGHYISLADFLSAEYRPGHQKLFRTWRLKNSVDWINILDHAQSEGQMSELCELIIRKVDVDDRFAGLPEYQLSWIITAFDEGLNYADMLEPGLSNAELAGIFESVTAEGRKRRSLRF